MIDKSKKTQIRYLAYLLRLWLENGGDRQLWRASLEKAQNGERLVFANLVDLFAFLDDEIESLSTDSNNLVEGEI